mmetsp:Transcript_62512/g.182760  ORF Transcript_62512/g.182760 Transcript_62512/m.182760 type:complete len:91 (+) Transcript_62512:199-471(+)
MNPARNLRLQPQMVTDILQHLQSVARGQRPPRHPSLNVTCTRHPTAATPGHHESFILPAKHDYPMLLGAWESPGAVLSEVVLPKRCGTAG